MIPVILAEGRTLARQALRALLENSGAFVVAAEVATPEELAVAVIAYPDAVLIVDTVTHRSLNGAGEATPDAKPPLSARERQVMLLLVAGKALKEIANQLEVSAKTVSTYRERILKKLSLKSNADLVRYALSFTR